jgi:hypothetical protein
MGIIPWAGCCRHASRGRGRRGLGAAASEGGGERRAHHGCKSAWINLPNKANSQTVPSSPVPWRGSGRWNRQAAGSACDARGARITSESEESCHARACPERCFSASVNLTLGPRRPSLAPRGHHTAQRSLRSGPTPASTNTRWDQDPLRVAWCCSTRALKPLASRLAAIGPIATNVCPLAYLRPSRERCGAAGSSRGARAGTSMGTVGILPGPDTSQM